MWGWTPDPASPSPPARRFFEDLERRHKEQVWVEDISDILEEHAEHHFHPYVAYCTNEVYQQRALQRLTCVRGGACGCRGGACGHGRG